MRKIGIAPPRKRENDALKFEIYEERYKQSHKAPMPKVVIVDQLGNQEPQERYYMPCDYKCVQCGEEYIPVVCDPNDWGRYRRLDGTEYLLCNKCKEMEVSHE